MALKEIVIYPDPRLKQMTEPVTRFDAPLGTLLDDMAETMYEARGVGIAAPQIGVLQQVTVIDVGYEDEDDEETEVSRPRRLKGRGKRKIEIVNPQIISRSGKTRGEEGCLSIPEYREYVERSEKVTVEAQNRHGERFTLEADGLLSICLQHEIDHLHGILFIDRISQLKRQFFLKKYQPR